MGGTGGPAAGTTDRDGPLTWYQEAGWWNQFWNPPEESYPPMSDVWYLPERPTVEAVRTVFAELTARHEVLRTSLLMGADGLPYQGVHAPGGMRTPIRAVPLGELREDVAGALGTFRRPGPGGPAGPRWRAVLGERAGRVPAVGFAGDRLVMDGWSLIELRRQFMETLHGARTVPDGPAPLQPLARADHERSAAGRAKADAALRHLAEVFGRAQGPLFPGPPARPETPRYVEASVRSPELLRCVGHVARAHRVTRPAVVLAALAAVLASRAGRDGVPIRSLCANRTTAAERTGVLGLYQPAHLVLDLSGDPAMPDVLKRTWRESLRAYGHTEYPPDEFREVVVHTARGRGSVPRFQLDFDFVSGAGTAPRQAGTGAKGKVPPIEHRGSEQGRPGYALFQARIVGEEIMLALDADTALVPRDEIDRLLSWTARALFRLAADADVRLRASGAAIADARLSEFGAAIGMERRADERQADERQAEARRGPAAFAGAGAGAAVADPAAERALREAFLAAHQVERMDLDDDYVGAGGRLRTVPRLVSGLARHGFGGLLPEHVETPVSMRSVAAALRRAPEGSGR